MSCKIQFLVYAGLVLGVPSRSSKRQYGVQASTLPTADDVAHISALEVKREGWLYGPSIAGNTSFYPTGTLGTPAAEAQYEDLMNFEAGVFNNATADANVTGAAVIAAGGLTSLDSYSVLYDGQWLNSIPDGL